MNDARLDDEINWAVSFPLPFRVMVLVGLGILGWATNLHGLKIYGVDAVSTMELRVDPSQQPISLRIAGVHLSTPSSTYGPVYRLALAYFSWCFTSWALFRYLTYGNVVLTDVFGYIPGVSTLIILFVLVCPFNIFHKRERDKFLSSIRRCLFSSMDSPVYFADVVFADVFTSFAKVLGDVWLCMRMLAPGNSVLVPPREDGWLRWVMPAIMSLPYLVRFRQCIIEYSSPSNNSHRPLYNAVKYATSFPVIFLSAAQRIVVTELSQEKGDEVMQVAWHGEHPLFRLWLLFAAINSLYSFWWDISNDWGLDLLKPKAMDDARNQRWPPRRLVLPHLHSGTTLMSPSPAEPSPRPSQPYPYGLRPTILYPLPVYPLLIFLNLVLRLTWSIKLSSHLHSKSDGSITIFCLEIAEIIRRWMWVFIRVEWETIKKLERDVGGEADYELVQTPDVEDIT
ncbi:EXS-domain-containing protein [Armillaria gallica]|uniref:EXS-domain-containing protein n=1 Tax=Armillaria gallica TaxID=47427 RepID=A0A2H3D8G1_ARMGA|nr:EXS-domain-containing protein [Armillaria gallica]